jgi:hypothetical protein
VENRKEIWLLNTNDTPQFVSGGPEQQRRFKESLTITSRRQSEKMNARSIATDADEACNLTMV